MLRGCGIALGMLSVFVSECGHGPEGVVDGIGAVEVFSRCI